MAETFFLTSVATYLSGAGLAPAPKLAGVAEPVAAAELPAIVLSLEQTARANPGLGERGTLMRGVLPVVSTIDLANPFLPDDPTFRLVDATNRRLILPHGGLVRQDGSDPGDQPLAAADISVTVAGGARTVVAGVPAAGEVRADGRIGTLTFGDALPGAGLVVASYRLGQWEQRLERISGTLRLDVCAANAADAVAVSGGAIDALLAPAVRTSVRRLVSLVVTSLGSIGAAEALSTARRRTARFAFTFEREINRPDSSGGVIARIPVTSRQGDGGDPPGFVPEGTERFTISA
ncbi:MAG: hypothetical protein ACT4P7_15610 [Gemmatimonadaceae bacterium]